MCASLTPLRSRRSKEHMWSTSETCSCDGEWEAKQALVDSGKLTRPGQMIVTSATCTESSTNLDWNATLCPSSTRGTQTSRLTASQTAVKRVHPLSTHPSLSWNASVRATEIHTGKPQRSRTKARMWVLQVCLRVWQRLQSQLLYDQSCSSYRAEALPLLETKVSSGTLCVHVCSFFV